jgi:hypothetical protein
MKNGGNMSVTIVMVFAFAALVASAFMYIVRENNDYKVLADQVKAANSQNEVLIKKLDSSVIDNFGQMNELKKAIAAYDEKLMLIDKKFKDLEYEALKPKMVNIYARKPIPIQVMNPKNVPAKKVIKNERQK